MSQDGLATVTMNAAVRERGGQRGGGGEVEALEHVSNDSVSQKSIFCYSAAQVCFQAAQPLLVVVQAATNRLSDTLHSLSLSFSPRGISGCFR